jgi:hypothetical protein
MVTKLEYQLAYEDETDRVFRKLITKLEYQLAYEDVTDRAFWNVGN